VAAARRASALGDCIGGPDLLLPFCVMLDTDAGGGGADRVRFPRDAASLPGSNTALTIRFHPAAIGLL